MSCLAEEVEVLANILRTWTFSATTERVVVEVVASLLQLVGETVVGVVEVKATVLSIAHRVSLCISNVHVILSVLKSLQLPRLLQTPKSITVLENTFVAITSTFVAGQSSVEAEERHGESLVLLFSTNRGVPGVLSPIRE